MNFLLTGSTGFLGQYLLRQLMLDGHTVATMERLPRRPVTTASHPVLYHDFRAPVPKRLLDSFRPDYIIHAGAEVHGLRSLENPELFVQSNAMGTLNMLEAARVWKPKKFVYISSAEAVGSIPAPFKSGKDAVLRPSNPYAAAKATGELLTRSYSLSYGIPHLTIRTMNLFGERQDISKFLPATIKKVLNGDRLTCHVNQQGISGSRQWIYVQTLARAIANLTSMEFYPSCVDPCAENIALGTYHIVGPEITNMEIINLVKEVLNRPNTEVQSLEPGASHDMRYALDGSPFYRIKQAMADMTKTIQWYEENPEWLREF